MQTTGNASRGLAGTPGIGPGNFFLQPGTKSAQEIIGDIKEGLFVTEFLGFGVNLVTGDFSRGASGLWIQNGEFAFPVEEITVAGNLKDMFFNISEIGNDLEFRSSIASPTLRIDGMTVAGRITFHRRSLRLSTVSSRPERSGVEGPAVSPHHSTAGGKQVPRFLGRSDLVARADKQKARTEPKGPLYSAVRASCLLAGTTPEKNSSLARAILPR